MERVRQKPPQSLRDSRRAGWRTGAVAHWCGAEQTGRIWLRTGEERDAVSHLDHSGSREARSRRRWRPSTSRQRSWGAVPAICRSAASRIWFHAIRSRCDVQGRRAEARPICIHPLEAVTVR
jgi:hypothetical protein